MNTPHLLVLAAAVTAAHAGTPEPIAAPPAPKEEPWITPTLNLRARYEFGDVDGFDPSHALTTRERIGLKTKAVGGLSALVEGEFTQSVIDDYNAGGGAPPFTPGNTGIADPRNAELNQAYLQYSGFDTVARIGRQRIIYDNAAFIGNVGWRQNEQTYDAISLSNRALDGLTFDYAYIDQVNRIFGSHGTGVSQDVDSDVHLLHATYTGVEGLTLVGYAYLMEFDNPLGWDNDTFGLSAKGTLGGIDLYGELAWQDDAGPLNNMEALYGHFIATKPLFDTHALTLGIEHLDAGFQTPLATVHALNGFADAFIGSRIGGAHGGITDPYLSYSLPIFWGMKWTTTLHAFGDNSISTDRGWEIDSVLARKFNDNLLAIAKAAHFETDGVNPRNPYPTATRISVELNYTF